MNFFQATDTSNHALLDLSVQAMPMNIPQPAVMKLWQAFFIN